MTILALLLVGMWAAWGLWRTRSQDVFLESKDSLSGVRAESWRREHVATHEPVGRVVEKVTALDGPRPSSNNAYDRVTVR